MTDPEPDDLFRVRLLRVVSELDRPRALVGIGPQLDDLGRKYDRFRTGVPLRGTGFEPRGDDPGRWSTS